MDDDAPVTVELDAREFVTRPEGRRAWVREGRRALESQRERERRPIAKGRTDRLFEACRRQRSSATASRSSSHPTPGYARRRDRDGPGPL
jgi:hypothetical protein